MTHMSSDEYLENCNASSGPSGQLQLPAVLPTNQAAALIMRRPQTLRKWASLESGPIQPIRINGRLAWRVEDLRRLLQGAK